MTWLSRLLPQKTTLQRLANSNHDVAPGRAGNAAGLPTWRTWRAARCSPAS